MSAVLNEAAAAAAPLKTTWLRDALAWFNGDASRSHAQADEPALYAWLWQSIQGDFNEERSTGQIAFDAAVSMIPLVDQLCDVRDLVANCRKLKGAPDDGAAWLALGLTLIGLFPSLGSLLKGVLKLFFVCVRRYGLDHLLRATEQAMGWVITFLRKREVQRLLRQLHVDEVFGWLAGNVRALKARISTQALLDAFDRGIKVLQGLLGKVAHMPVVGERARATLQMVQDVRLAADAKLAEAVQPLQKVLDAVAERLGREALLARQAINGVTNVHFRGGLPEAQALSLMKGDPRPKWLSKGSREEWPGQELDDVRKKDIDLDGHAAKGWPSLKKNEKEYNEDLIASFHKMAADTIRGPARLYRVVSPSSAAMSDCWVSEEVFKRLNAAPDPRAAWRQHLAVWPHWNANGQFVMYEVKAGEELKVWRGPASSQTLERKGLKDAHLEGGWEQVVFTLPKGSPLADTLNYYERLPGGALRGPIPQAEAYALGRDRTLQLRAQINHPNISGPYSTHWGYTDFELEAITERIGLPALLGQVTHGQAAP